MPLVIAQERCTSFSIQAEGVTFTFQIGLCQAVRKCTLYYNNASQGAVGCEDGQVYGNLKLFRNVSTVFVPFFSCN